MHVCVVGAGPSGLVALKELRAAGLEATAFEAQERPGGLFVFREADGLVWDTLQLTSSALVTQFSDFPPERPTSFWRHDEYVEYLGAYAARFDLFPHIRCSAPVTSAERVSNGWNVQVGSDAPRHFDAVAVCSGIHRRAHTPRLPGLGTFTGELFSSTQFRRAEPFRGRRVVCVGAGESGGDIVPQIAEVAAECTVSLRRGASFLPRFVNGSPGDYLMTRVRHGVGHDALSLVRRLAQERDAAGTHDADEGPDHFQADPAVGRVVRTALRDTGLPPWQQFATKTTALPESIARGRCQLKPGIASIQGATIRFDDETEVEADVIVFCTGFEPPAWPFLGAHAPAQGLYGRVFAPELGTTAAFIGFARPAIGSIPVISELQARWVARVLSGRCTLPAPQEMRAAIDHDDDVTKRTFPKDFEQLPYLVAHARYLDWVAREIGCMPDVRELRRTPGLLRAFYSAPFTAMQYRLVGPDALPDAAQRLLALPLQPRTPGDRVAARLVAADSGPG